MIYSGNLTETLYFYTIEERQSESGFKSTVETLKFSVRAQRLKNKQTLLENAEEMFHQTSLTFKMRKRDIRETDIVVYENERYRILSIDEYKAEQTIILSKINE